MPENDQINPYHITPAQLQWQDNDVPCASQFDDIYFSTNNGLKETEYVFLRHNQLAERWQLFKSDEFNSEESNSEEKPIFTIAETGFGTGLNFLAAWRLWSQTAPLSAQLHFITTEKYPLTKQDLKRALTAWPELAEWSKQLIDQYPPLIPGHHLLAFNDNRVQLHLLLGDANNSLQQLLTTDRLDVNLRQAFSVNAWFLDGFAPAKNASLWNDELYQLMARLSAPNATVATFTAVGDVRRGLTACGFDMRKAPGFGQKRDMLCGRFNSNDNTVRLSSSTPPSSHRTKGIKAPWAHTPKTPTGRTAAIIGGGLAGVTTAYALAQRGWQVTIIERDTKLAQGASGNPQGMLYTKLSPEPGVLNQFTLSSYLYALHYYRQLVSENIITQEMFDFCGVLQLTHTEKEQKLHQQLQSLFSSQSEWVQFVDRSQVSKIAGIACDYAGCWFPQAGWISPPDLCRQLANHPLIKTLTLTEAIRLERVHHQPQAQWQIHTVSEEGPTIADIVVIANSRDAKHFQQSQQLPLKSIRGQITLLPTSRETEQLKTVICHEGYLTPAINHHHSLGATFDNGDTNIEIRVEDHQRNVESLRQVQPQWLSSTINLNELEGRAGLRCTTPDYMPIVGPLHQHEQFLVDYAGLRKNAHRNIETPGSYYPGLFINVGHGSRGLTSTPICSQLLANLIDNAPPPLPRQLLQALNPARFVIRDLIRNKV